MGSGEQGSGIGEQGDGAPRSRVVRLRLAKSGRYREPIDVPASLTGVRIRLATFDDAEVIYRQVRPVIERFIVPEFTDEGRRTLLGQFSTSDLENRFNGNFRFHLAEIEGNVVGSIGIREDRHVFHLFVSEAYHRRGIARALWETAKAAARLGNDAAGFTVNSSRYAVPVYRALGFREVGPEEERQGIISVSMRYDW